MKPFYIHKLSLFYKKAFLVLCFFLVSLPNIYAQAWFQKLYAMYRGDSTSGIGAVKQLADGNYILAGGIFTCPTISSCTNNNAMLIKTNNRGDVLWTRVMGGVRDDGLSKVVQTTDGNYVFAGETQSFGLQATANVYGEYIYVVKTNPNGDTLYTRIYGGTNTDYSHNNEIADLQATSDGGFIMTAYINYKNFSPYAYSSILVKCNAQGDTLWTKRYNTPNQLSIYHIKQVADSGYVLSGAVADSVGAAHENGFISRIDKKGNVLWAKMYGGVYDDYFNSILKCGSGYLAVGGSLSFSAIHNTYMYAVRLDSLGDTLWTRVYGPANCNYGLSLSDSTAYMLGLSASSLGTYAILKINTNTGACLMKNYYGQADLISVCDVTQDGGFVISGGTSSYSSYLDYGILIKADSAGNTGCNQAIATMTITSTQTNVNSITMQTYHYPMYVNSTQTHITYGNLPDSTLCSSPLGINEYLDNNKLVTVYPNPAQSSLQIIADDGPITEVKIYDLLGNQIKSEELKTQNSITQMDVNSLTNGVYFIQVKTSTNIYTQKIIVQH